MGAKINVSSYHARSEVGKSDRYPHLRSEFHALIKHKTLTVTRPVDRADPLNQIASPSERRSESHGGVALPLRENDIVLMILQGHFEPSGAL